MIRPLIKEEARSIVPHAFRRDAKITQLIRFTMDEIEDALRHHAG